jgi:hypothetical protein
MDDGDMFRMTIADNGECVWIEYDEVCDIVDLITSSSLRKNIL